MPLPRTSLSSFLAAAKTALNSPIQQSTPLTFVIGNESADLDSLCSAVVLAYLRTYASKSSSDTLYIPLSNLPRADLSLRPELLPVLSHAGIGPKDLITLSDLPQTQLAPEHTKWILVDHNALQGKLGATYGSRLVGCIDHHDEEHKVPEDCGEEPRVVRKSGSCSSLVIEYCRKAWDDLAAKSSSEEEAKWDSELSRLALAPILIDTTNLTDKAKTTPVDRDGVEYLQKWIMAHEVESYSSTTYFDEVSKAKQDLDGLPLSDILRKDYKQWTQADSSLLGIGSVVKTVGWMSQKAGTKKEFLNSLETFADARNLSICSIMTTSKPENGPFMRELLVWARDKKGIEAAKKFEADSREKLGLEAAGDRSLDLDEDGQWRRFWKQTKTESSRKQVAPLLRTAMGQ